MVLGNYYMITLNESYARTKSGQPGKLIYVMDFWIADPDKSLYKPENRNEYLKWKKENIVTVQVSKKAYEALKKATENLNSTIKSNA